MSQGPLYAQRQLNKSKYIVISDKDKASRKKKFGTLFELKKLLKIMTLLRNKCVKPMQKSFTKKFSKISIADILYFYVHWIISSNILPL